MATTKRPSPYGTRKFESIDEYHSTFPKPVREILDKIRMTVSSAAPGAIETISYNIPTFKMKRNLVHYAAFTNHIGFYPTTVPIAAFKKELAGFKTSKGTIQFPLDRPVPYDLIRELVKYRVKQETEGTAKSNKKTVRSA